MILHRQGHRTVGADFYALHVRHRIGGEHGGARRQRFDFIEMHGRRVEHVELADIHRMLAAGFGEPDAAAEADLAAFRIFAHAAAGRKHPMYVGKLDVFNAPTVHLDEVEALPAGATVLATNAMSDVQSVEIRTNGSVAWAVQYHPEYPLREIAAIVRRIGTRLIEEGFFRDANDITTFAHDLDTLDRDPECKRLSWRHGISKNVLDKKLRVGEVANWIEFQVLPTRVKRGRG